MTTRRRTMVILVTLAGLASLTACGNANPAAGLKLPIAQTRDASPSAAPGGAGAAADSGSAASGGAASGGAASGGAASGGAASGASADKPVETQPVPEPTVAKTQKWVKIFSGPSTKDIKPNADKKKGSNTVELNAVPNAQIGTYVTDGAGRTLYRFDNDKAKPPKSNCNGDCATAWPPLLIKSPGKIYPDGIDPKLIGYVERADGHCQVTIAGWPVYYFVADNKPGDLNGQGLNGKWFAIAPNGIRTKALPGFPLNSAGN